MDFKEPMVLEIVAYFEGHKENTKDILEWEDLDCTHLYFVDPLQEDLDELIIKRRINSEYMSKGWEKISENKNLEKAIEKLEKEVNSANEKRGKAKKEDLIKEALEIGYITIEETEGLSGEEINQDIIDHKARIKAIEKAEEEGLYRDRKKCL